VLHGGDSPERPGSLISGRAAADALEGHGYRVELIDTSAMPVADLVDRIDVALIALHGPGGEDGKMQGALDTIGIPYAGSGVLTSATAMYKPRFLEINTSPGLSPVGNLATMAAADGIEYEKMIDLVAATAFTKPRYLP
jgi:D-alanine-D-alanine ligase